MILEHEMSFINVAEEILKDRKEPVDLYDLFDAVVLQKQASLGKDELDLILNTFYADLTSSAKFVYTGSNTWDLKEHHSVEMWEKDGSYYSEYKEVHDAVLEERLEAAARRELEHQDMLEKRKEREAMLQAARESQDSPALEMDDAVPVIEVEAEAEVIVEEIVTEEPYTQPEDASDYNLEEDTLEEELIELSEEVLEEDDFDEDEYNKRMDEFEDLYEDD